METIEQHLQEHGVRPTSVRILVWKTIRGRVRPFTLADMEELMPHMDHSSLFRTLRLFVERQLLHEINDGTGHQKYCICRCHDDEHLNHIHFTCVRCGKTYCMTNHQIPHVSLPCGFEVQNIEYNVKGICQECSNN